MLSRALLPYLLKWTLIALIGLVLFGNLSTQVLLRVVLCFVALRLVSLVIEAFRKLNPADGQEARVLKSNSSDVVADFAAAEMDQAEARGVPPPRGRPELLAEALGLMGFCLLLPLTAGMAVQSFFSFHRSQEMGGVLVVASGLALYALPLFRRLIFRRPVGRILWWAAPVLPLGLALLVLVGVKHSYLNPLSPERDRLEAERVVALKAEGNNVVAAGEVDWIFQYAHDLEARGDKEGAIKFYEQGLELDANRETEHARLTALERAADPAAGVPKADAAVDTYAPLWPEGMDFPAVTRCQIGPSLEHIHDCTVVLVPVGAVPEGLVDAVSFAIRHELGLPVLSTEVPMHLSDSDRTHGLLVGAQWNVDSLQRAFIGAYPNFPAAPLKYVLLTQQDLYQDGTNFVFSASYPWGAIVSSARFVMMDPKEDQVLARTAKQSLCALLKSFGLPASPDRDCVTSFVRSMPEFDLKGNRPNARTLNLFWKALADWSETWPQSRAGSHAPNLDELRQKLDALAAPRG